MQPANSTIGVFIAIASVISSSALEGRVFGLDGRAVLSAEQLVLYSNMGRIECPNGDQVIAATGWINHAPDTVVTSAHSFYDFDTNQPLDPTTCTFAMYDGSGDLIDRISIRYVVSRWDLNNSRFDLSQDFAVVKISRTPNHKINAPSIAIARGLDNRAVTLIAFHGDLMPRTAPRSSPGKLYKIAAAANVPVRGLPGSNPDWFSSFSRMFKSDFDSSRGASGGMVIDNLTGAIVGIHNGGGAKTRDFDDSEYNYEVYFDKQFMAELEAVAGDKRSP